MSGETLLPCPFCGYPAELRTYKIPVEDNAFSMECVNYECVTHDLYRNEQQAIEAWNKRT